MLSGLSAIYTIAIDIPIIANTIITIIDKIIIFTVFVLSFFCFS